MKFNVAKSCIAYIRMYNVRLVQCGFLECENWLVIMKFSPEMFWKLYTLYTLLFIDYRKSFGPSKVCLHSQLIVKNLKEMLYFRMNSSNHVFTSKFHLYCLMHLFPFSCFFSSHLSVKIFRRSSALLVKNGCYFN